MLTTVERVQTAAEKALSDYFAGTDIADSARGAEVRRAAMVRFQEQGLPHRRIEEWKYTDLRTAMREAPALPETGDALAAGDLSAYAAGYRAVFVNGRLDTAASELPEAAGVTVTSLAEALEADAGLAERLDGAMEGADSPVRDLNTAFADQGMVIAIADGATLDRPLQIIHRFVGEAPASVFLRHALRVGDNATATVAEVFEGPDGLAYHVNTAARIDVGTQANVTYLRLQADGTQAFNLATLEADIGAGAELTLIAASFGAALSRVQASVKFSGEHAILKHGGLKMLRGKQHADLTMFVDHAVPNCVSEELEKTVLDDAARGVFQGKIVVRPDAQKTDGRMMTQALLLSEGAEADNKPELEIYADDVQCGHGATSGQIDETLLFYLRSRGIPESQARSLLIQAFAGEVVDEIEDEALRGIVAGHAARWLGVELDV